jgi:hypothetical protein
MALSFRDALERKRPLVKILSIPLDEEGEEAGEQYAACEAKLMEVRRQLERWPSDTTLREKERECEDELDAIRDELEGHTFDITFRALPGDELDALIEEHPPTKEQRTKWRKDNAGNPLASPPRHNSDTFPPALVAACSDLSEEDVKEVWHGDRFSMAERDSMYFTALQVNQTARIVDLGKAGRGSSGTGS